MKKILIFLTISLISTICFADECYVFIDKGIGYKEGEKRAIGQGQKGDVIEIVPATKQFEPTRAEFDRYQIIKANLTEKQKLDLMESKHKITIDAKGDEQIELVQQRIRKIDFESFSKKEQKAEINANEIIQKTEIKPIVPVGNGGILFP